MTTKEQIKQKLEKARQEIIDGIDVQRNRQRVRYLLERLEELDD